MAKYVMTWKPHVGGNTADNEASYKRVLAVFAKWSPPSELTFHEFLSRADGQGGYAVVSTDDVAVAAREIAKFTADNEFELVPVLEIADGVGLGQEAAAFRDGIS